MIIFDSGISFVKSLIFRTPFYKVSKDGKSFSLFSIVTTLIVGISRGQRASLVLLNLSERLISSSLTFPTILLI
jgi:hypothetical protein